jgi:hypothetical protein
MLTHNSKTLPDENKLKEMFTSSVTQYCNALMLNWENIPSNKILDFI